jgi:hypothetical protein
VGHTNISIVNFILELVGQGVLMLAFVCFGEMKLRK